MSKQDRPLPENLQPLSPKEKGVLDFVTEYFLKEGHSPSYAEIKDHFGLASFNSIQNYLKQLQRKNYIRLFPGQKRCIEILHTSEVLKDKLVQTSKKTELLFDSKAKLLQKSSVDFRKEVLSSPQYELPYLGRVAAGNPIERTHDNESIDLFPLLVKKPNSTFIVRVEGDSMIDEGINNQDYILVQQQDHAKSGDIVVATVDNESTVKRIYFGKSDMVELRPANSRLKSMFFPSNEIQIKGVVVGLVRKL